MAYGFPHIKENGQMLLIVVNLRSATLLENSQTCHLYWKKNKRNRLKNQNWLEADQLAVIFIVTEELT